LALAALIDVHTSRAYRGAALPRCIRLELSRSRVSALGLAALLASSTAGAETVRLQLKWRHQFQFAGYYAAQARGYYAAEGLDVSILEGGVERPPLATVLGGGAEFGVGDAEVLLARLKGAPIVVCAAIFQHSPYVLLSRHDRGIRTPADLVGARVMLSDDQGAAQVRAMLMHEGIDPGRVTILAQSWELDALIDRRVDAMSAYATVEPALLRARGVEPGLLRALDYGVDFYGDTLFTTEETLSRQPARVAAFRRASLKGWEYALQHADELAQLISEMPGVSARGVTREMLAHEAAAMRPFILPDIVEVGHMNPGRWQRIAETFVEAGLASSTERVGGLVYDPHPGGDHVQMRRIVWGAVGVLAVTGAVLIWNVQMRRSVRDRTRQIQAEVMQRRQAEEALREGEERYRSLFENAPDGILVADMEGRYVDANPSALSMLGYAREELIGMASADILAATEAPQVESALADLERGLEHRREWQFRRRDGSEFPADVIAKAVTGGRILALVRDASELRRAEAALRESQKRLLSIYDTVGDVIFLVALEPDGGFRFESVNQRFVATTGLPVDAVVGKRIEEVIPAASLPLVRERYREAVAAKALVRWEETTDYPTGRLTGEVSVAPIVDVAGRCTHLVGAVHDVTARKLAEERQAQAEQMLRQSQKLEGIGRLAGGIAHDFNNILGVILGYGGLMRRHLDDAHPARPRLEQVMQAAERAAGLTRQLLAFSRKQVMQPKLIDLAVVVGDMRRMLDRVLGEDVEIAVLGAERPGVVLADPTQVEQVVMNLVVNARDAMPKGGHLTIETANVDFDETYASAHPPALPGRFVMLAVSDTGVGMDAETQRQIFEPFFTTKPVGEGTGLGLATVYGIVKQMGGYVWVYSEVDRGTSFKVYLPRVEEAPAPETASAPPPPPARGRETLLVVEDSESLRDMIRELLADLGYTVLIATDGEEALALIENGDRPIDLVLTDVVMPKLGGTDLVKRLRASHPRLRVVYMSGYASGAVSRQGVLDEGSILLEKPFTAENLARTVRTALDAQRERG
jgi:PAS domain S-box-containing protein